MFFCTENAKVVSLCFKIPLPLMPESTNNLSANHCVCMSHTLWVFRIGAQGLFHLVLGDTDDTTIYRDTKSHDTGIAEVTILSRYWLTEI